MNISAPTTGIGRSLPSHPRLRVYRPWILRPRVSRQLAIRLGPDVIDLYRERRIGRIVDRVAAAERLSSHDNVTPAPLDPDRRDIVETDDLMNTRARLEQSIAQLERELNHVEARLRWAKLELTGVFASIARHRFDEPVAYAYRWNPDLARAGSPAPTVVYVPGIVRAHVSPIGRLVDVTM